MARLEGRHRATRRDDAGAGAALHLLEAAAFQWINPKALVAALSAVAHLCAAGSPRLDLAVMLAVFGLVDRWLGCTWAGFGWPCGGFLKDRRRARIFNIAMALLLVASIVPMVLDGQMRFGISRSGS